MKIRGINIELHDSEDLSNHIRTTKDFFEAPILDYLRDNHKTQETILDIGANIGNHTLYFANFLSYKSIIAFEPIPKNFEILKKNLKRYPRVGLVNKAVSYEGRGSIKMVENPLNMGNSREDPDGYIIADTTSIDELYIQNVSLIKIDVEGLEISVLGGAQKTINRCHPLILIEDWNQEYSRYLPKYEVERAWPEHQTYLYRWA